MPSAPRASSCLRKLSAPRRRRPGSGGCGGGGDSRAATPAALVEKGLTARQIDVLRELLEGKSNKQICRDLNLAMGTVKAHVTAVLTALGVSTRAEAMAAVDRNGWRSPAGATSAGPDSPTPTPTVVPIRSRRRHLTRQDAARSAAVS